MIRPRPRLHYPDVAFHHWLWKATERDPEAVCLVFEDEQYTFRDIEGLSNSLASALRALGVQPGSRVAIMMGNRPEWIFAAEGVSITGGAFVSVNSSWKVNEVRHALSLTNPVAVIADAGAAKVLAEADAPGIRICIDDEPPDSSWQRFWQLVHEHPAQRLPDEHASYQDIEGGLFFSSGTTGLPKAVIHTHGSLSAAVLQWTAILGLQSSDYFQLAVPITHILGGLALSSAFVNRSRVRLFRRFDLDAMLRSIHMDRITLSFTVAPIAIAMANHPDLERYDFSSLRYLSWSATPASRDVALRITERTGARWLLQYGATEAPVLSGNPVNQPRSWRLDSPGIPAPDMEFRVLDVETAEALPFGEEGELVVRGPNMMRGYLPEEANAEAFRPGGWYRTGDIGWMEPEGWIHITDRAKEMLKVSGFQVSPVELEKVLLTHDAVADCAVVGGSHDLKGEVPVAMVVRREGADVSAKELQALIETSLASYKKLAAVHFINEIPRTASGKVLRRQLQEQLGS